MLTDANEVGRLDNDEVDGRMLVRLAIVLLGEETTECSTGVELTTTDVGKPIVGPTFVVVGSNRDWRCGSNSDSTPIMAKD